MVQLQQILQVASLAIVVFLFINRAVRKQPWSSLGFTSGFTAKLRQNWYLVVLVAVLLQVAVPVFAKLFQPELLTHISGRLPDSSGLAFLIATILIGTLMEELVYRFFLQGLLKRVMPVTLAIVLSAIVFACAHWSQADSLGITLLDVGLVFLDGVIYGFIFQRSKNVVLSWSVHAVADFVGLAMLLLLR